MRKVITLLLLISLLIFSRVAYVEEPSTDRSRFWHIGIVVKDMELMHDFYTRVLGLVNTTDLAFADASTTTITDGVTPIEGLDSLLGIDKTYLKVRHYSDPQHEQLLEFLHYPDSPVDKVSHTANSPLGWNHFGLEVTDIDGILELMQSEGIGTIVGGPIVLEEFKNNAFVFIKDPEGNLVELYEKAR